MYNNPYQIGLFSFENSYGHFPTRRAILIPFKPRFYRAFRTLRFGVLKLFYPISTQDKNCLLFYLIIQHKLKS